MYTSYELTPKSKKFLLNKFPPKHEKHIGTHVTHEFGVKKETNTPPTANVIVVGYQNDPNGIEALIVSVNGNTTRPDGGVYHITWSLDPEKFKPVDSNNLISRLNYKLVLPTKVLTTPTISH